MSKANRQKGRKEEKKEEKRRDQAAINLEKMPKQQVAAGLIYNEGSSRDPNNHYSDDIITSGAPDGKRKTHPQAQPPQLAPKVSACDPLITDYINNRAEFKKSWKALQGKIQQSASVTDLISTSPRDILHLLTSR